jgi:CHAT domain-containing protein
MKHHTAVWLAVFLLPIFSVSVAAQQHPQESLSSITPALISGRAAEAKDQLMKALAEARQKNDAQGEAMALFYLGLAEMGLNDVDGSRASLQEAGKKMAAQNDVIGQWLTIIVLAQMDKALGSVSQAITQMEEAFAVINKAKTSNAPFSLKTLITLTSSSLPPGMGSMLETSGDLMKPMILQYMLEPVTHDLYGSLLTDAGQLDKAEVELNAAAGGMDLFQGMYDFSLAAHFGDLRFRQHRYDDARSSYQKALSSTQQIAMNPLGDDWIRVDIYDRLARLESMIGHIDDAMRWSDKTLEIIGKTGTPVQECLALETRGVLLMRSERFGESEGVLKRAMQLAVAAKNVARQASIESHFGSLAIMNGNYGSAAAHLEKSVRLHASLNDPIAEAFAWGSLFDAYMLTDNFAAAEDALTHARALVEKSHFTLGMDMISLSETWLRFRKGQATPAEVRASVERLTRNPMIRDFDIAQDIEQITKKTMDMIEKPDGSMPSIKSHGMPNFDYYAAIAKGLQEMERGNAEEARKIWLGAVDKIPSSDMRAGLFGLLGASYWKDANYEQASHWFSEATKSLDTGGKNLPDTMLSPYLGSYHRAYYDVLIETYLRNGKVEAAFETTERARGRAFLRLLGNHRLRAPAGADSKLVDELEKLRIAIAGWDERPQPGVNVVDLRKRYEMLLSRIDATSAEYASMTSAEPLSLDAVRKELPEHTTLISYYVSLFGTYAWIIDAQKIESVKLTLDAAQLHRLSCWTEQIGRTRAPRVMDGNTQCGSDPAKPDEAYAALIAPLREKIRTDRLMIIPHGELHYVPFAALYDPKTGRYLVQDYTITYTPSASALRFLRAKESPVDGGSLVLGDPEAPAQSRLQGANTEALNVAQKLHTTPKLGKKASKDLLYPLGKIDLLHIAAHAGYDATSPLFSAIYLAEGRGKKGPLTVDEIQSKIDLKGVNLVVLSACRSGVGKRSGGDEIVGLTRAILYAGSPGVISTLWDINDKATAPLIGKFYDHLLNGDSAADALRCAQIEVLGEQKTADPYYWAAFLLTGDPAGRWSSSKTERCAS